MQRLAISGLLSVILIVLLTGTFVTRRDLANVVERGGAPEERSNEQQANPAWVQSNVIPGQDEAKPLEDKDRWVDPRQRQSEPSAVGPPPVPVPGPYVIKPPNPPLDDVTNQRREKIKEVSGSRACLLSSSLSISLSVSFSTCPAYVYVRYTSVVIVDTWIVGISPLVFLRGGNDEEQLMDEKRGEIVNIEIFFSGECDARKAEVCFLQNLRSILKIVLTSQLFFALVNRASSIYRKSNAKLIEP